MKCDELKKNVIEDFGCKIEWYEADEVDAAIAELKKQVHDYTQGLYVIQARAEKELRQQKYKRCLALAKWCDAEADVADADGDYNDMRFYQRWTERWLSLADKFKEAK